MRMPCSVGMRGSCPAHTALLSAMLNHVVAGSHNLHAGSSSALRCASWHSCCTVRQTTGAARRPLFAARRRCASAISFLPSAP